MTLRSRGGRLTAGAQPQPGLIVANYGRHFLVETATGERVICHSRGKKSQGVVGDRVMWQASRDEGTIERIEPRRNLFYRRDEIRTKSFAANLDQVLILIAAEPAFSSNQLSRALIAAEAEGITPLIALNKSDLIEPFARAWQWLAPYRDMGYHVLPVALKHTTDTEEQALFDLLHGKTTLVLGPSGAGKSTLINRLVPGAAVLTGELSQALRRRQTHDHQHHLVLDGRSQDNRIDRLARFPGVRTAPHRCDAAGTLYAGSGSPCRPLQVLQLHPPARTRMRRDRRTADGHAAWLHQR